MNRSISYNNFDLQNSTYLSARFRDLDSVKNVNYDFELKGIRGGRKLLNTQVDSKTFSVIVIVKGNSMEDLEEKVDTMLANFYPRQEAPLIIDYAGELREWDAIVDEVSPTGNLGQAKTREYQVTFRTTGAGRSFDTQTKQFANVTDSQVTQTIDFGGTTEALPTYTFTVNSEEDLTRIFIKNVNTNSQALFEQTFSDGDVVIYDQKTETLTLNGVIQQRLGISPLTPAGSNDIEFTFQSTSHDVTIDVEWNKRYI